jgi:VanZ family protein
MIIPEFLKGVYYGKYQHFVHFLVSLIIFLIAQKYFGVQVGVIIALAIGILKELFDKFIRKTSFSISDIAVDILGIVTGLLLVTVFNLT